MSTLTELKERHPFLQGVIAFWKEYGVTDDDLPDPLPQIDLELFMNPEGNDVWLAENFPKVAAKLEAGAIAAGILPPRGDQ